MLQVDASHMLLDVRAVTMSLGFKARELLSCELCVVTDHTVNACAQLSHTWK